jgi:agmatine deiminase
VARTRRHRSCERTGAEAYAAVAGPSTRPSPSRWPSRQALRALRRTVAVRVVELSTDGAWLRPGPRLLDASASAARRGLALDAWGGTHGGLYTRGTAMNGREQVLVDAPTLPRSCSRAARSAPTAGTVLATRECLLNPNRNPELSRAGGTPAARSSGAEKVIWLGRGPGTRRRPVDKLACCRPGPGGLSWSEDPSDPASEVSRDARARLEPRRTPADSRSR